MIELFIISIKTLYFFYLLIAKNHELLTQFYN